MILSSIHRIQMNNLLEAANLTLSQTTHVKFSNGTSVELDVFNVPIGYTKVRWQEKFPESWGPEFRAYSPRRSGYEIYVFPKVKKYYEQYTA